VRVLRRSRGFFTTIMADARLAAVFMRDGSGYNRSGTVIPAPARGHGGAPPVEPFAPAHTDS
jgi:hypothetical protein